MVQVIATFAFHFFHRKTAGDYFAGRRPDRRQIWFARIGAVVEHGDGLAINIDGDYVGFELDLSGEADRRKQADDS